jgi:5'(3')-deoxyribonucleotidase
VRLGIDLDGVVADFSTGWMSFYNEQYGTALVPEMVTSWDAIPELTRFVDMNEFWAWSRDLNGSSLFRHLDTYPGVVEKMWELARDRFELVIITTKPFFAIHDTFAWISEKQIPTREVHIIEDKWKVDVEVYLDDSPHMIPDLLKHRPEKTVCRFVRPWNVPVDGAVDVHDWTEFTKIVRTLRNDG